MKNNLFLNFIFSNYDLEFFFGCIVGHLVLKTSIKYNYIILLVGVLGFLSGWYLVLQGVLMRYHTQAMLVLGISCGLIVLSATFLDLKYKLRVPKLLLLIGDASYSIYLTHFYIFVFIFKILAKVNRLNPFGGFITVSISLIIAVILGVTFHLVIERLLLKYLNGKLFNNMNSKQDQNYRKAI
ncbi:acyltransferase family protein [Neobacillus pocheonensis]|uniref:Acyltransferase family protein n=1 Tax=Neobacillus pocheonensis TaxID=363869 RepID=A0ABT0WHQ8_9BACI|nr:acyltransferase family protein [Neobacillus pocheonensis]